MRQLAGVARREQAFRQMSLKLHPDKQRGPGSDVVAAASRFSEVRAAYDLLQDAERRALYDMHGMEAVDDGQPRRAGGVRGGVRGRVSVHGAAAWGAQGCSPRHLGLQPTHAWLQPGHTWLQPGPHTVAGSVARTSAWSCL